MYLDGKKIMRNLLNVDTIQIEITSHCINRCANCTRFVGLVKPYHLSFDLFKRAIDSMIEFPFMTGIMGGEPLLHPEFEDFCEYALSKIPREKLGLWTCLPKGFEQYRKVICKTFGNVFINDHSRGDVYHHPFLVASKDLIGREIELFSEAEKCYFQDAWSPSINKKGAYFCEIAASLALLFPKTSFGWPVRSEWWYKTPKDYTSQIEEFCPMCGGCLKLKRRSSRDNGTYDITASNMNRFMEYGIDLSKCVEHDYLEVKECEQEPLATYKDQAYRDNIALRYGIFLRVNKNGFNEPHLMRSMEDADSILTKYKKRYSIGK
jgi:hypothetical protein